VLILKFTPEQTQKKPAPTFRRCWVVRLSRKLRKGLFLTSQTFVSVPIGQTPGRATLVVVRIATATVLFTHIRVNFKAILIFAKKVTATTIFQITLIYLTKLHGIIIDPFFRLNPSHNYLQARVKKITPEQTKKKEPGGRLTGNGNYYLQLPMQRAVDLFNLV
jgi:hypothetical protein